MHMFLIGQSLSQSQAVWSGKPWLLVAKTFSEKLRITLPKKTRGATSRPLSSTVTLRSLQA